MFFGIAKKRLYAEGGTIPSQNSDQGLDLDGQLKKGVEAYMQSEDPEIAKEVVTMLAQMMGVAPDPGQFMDQDASGYDQDGDEGGYPSADQTSQQPIQQQAQVPAGRNGMKIYRVGGSIDPKKKGATTQLVSPSTTKTPVFHPQDMTDGPVKNRVTTPQLGIAARENPGKTQVRQKIQSAAMAGNGLTNGSYLIGDKVAYDYGNNKGELAGENSNITFNTPAVNHTLPLLPIPDYNSNQHVPLESEFKTPASEIRQNNGQGPKRRLQRVDYLQGKGYGRNKRTEAGN